MPGKIKLGIIGAGQIGTHHLEAYAQIAEAEMVAVCDVREEAAQAAAQRFGIPHVYTDYHELLKRDDITSVDVCLHNRLHCSVTVDVLEAGKNAYCEKPMSWTYRDAKVMYDAAKALGRMLHIQLGRIYSLDTRAAKRLIDDGKLGEIYAAKAIAYRRRGRPWVDGYGSTAFVNTGTSGGGTMLDTAVYNISRMMYLLGNPAPLTISGATYQELWGNMYPERKESGQYNVEELGMGFVRLAGGIGFWLEEAWAIHSENPNACYIYGDRAGIKVQPLTYFTTVSDMEMNGSFLLEAAERRWQSCFPETVWYTSSQKHWMGAQLGRVPLLDTAGIALNTALITEGVYLSGHLRREVTVADIEAATPEEYRI
jgi:predicted dehydrogenase